MLKRTRVVRAGLWDISVAGVYARTTVTKLLLSRMCLERPTIDGKSPVGEKDEGCCEMFPSTAGHGKPRRNLGGPSPKAKYYSVTDSELVP